MRGRVIAGVVGFVALHLGACGDSDSGAAREGVPDGGGGSDAGDAGTGGGKNDGDGGSEGATGGAGSKGGSNGTGGGAAEGGTGTGGTGDDGGSDPCEPFGRYGSPGTTFTLPVTGGGAIYFPDVQASFPEVDWARLDRLYVPAGEYTALNLGNLPVRDASRPLVITNHGGQVKVGPNLGANYIWSMGGGANWILTGRYDPESGTGDAAFPGHRCGVYAGSRGNYGFLSDDAFDLTAPYLHMGLSVGSATDFEIEFVEITRSGFAGLRLLNPRAAEDPAFDMANVRIHDNYIHDTDGEGTYFGWTGAPPANLLPGLRVYNNRIVRTGNEALQIQDLGDGTEVYGNVIAFAALHWRDNGLGKYQDNNSQVQTREGNVSVRDNVFLGGAGTLLSFWSQPLEGDGDRHVTFEHNYMAATKSLGAYLGGEAAAGSDFRFVDNTFTGMDFTYDRLDPAATDPGTVFQISPTYTAPVEFTRNAWDGSRTLVNGIAGPEGSRGSITLSDNVNGAVAPIEFEDSGYPAGKPVQSLEIWAAAATVNPAAPAITYRPGDLVMFDAEMYECVEDATALRPDEHPEVWRKLPLPADDLRLKAGAGAGAYSGMGVH